MLVLIGDIFGSVRRLFSRPLPEKKSPGPGHVILPGSFLYPDTFEFPEDTYRTQDGLACFDFRFHKCEYHYEIEILSTPVSPYCTRFPEQPECGIMDSRIEKGFNGHTMAMRTYRQARELAIEWAEYIWPRIRKGDIKRDFSQR